ncbi:urea carboxylase [Enterococcus florum]|uniref:Urea carboxylase n=1 Tax=Enterococcus florum TaxID=2480627 RepID=A0A4V0WP54_9ENTE|nr:urea amidolyase associated protein UAAP1 [Enterococcus florum]GCF92669.1 urea carboxylase [Enterococcus florum]
MKLVYTKRLLPGEKWSEYVGAGKWIRLIAKSEDCNLVMGAYHAEHPEEKYNMPDSLKAQHTFFLTQQHLLMSDNGKMLMSLIKDTYGWHDTVCGHTLRRKIQEKYGESTYQIDRNQRQRNSYDNFSIELFRRGLGKRDLSAVVNLFSKVTASQDGTLCYHAENTLDKEVVLRTDAPVLLLLSNTPHPLNPATEYPRGEIQLEVYEGMTADLLDPVVSSCGENTRAFENNLVENQLEG